MYHMSFPFRSLCPMSWILEENAFSAPTLFVFRGCILCFGDLQGKWRSTGQASHAIFSQGSSFFIFPTQRVMISPFTNLLLAAWSPPTTLPCLTPLLSTLCVIAVVRDTVNTTLPLSKKTPKKERKKWRSTSCLTDLGRFS